MSHLPGAPQAIVDTYHTDLHAGWQTPVAIQEGLLREWDMRNFVIGARVATGEATEVYRVYDGSTDDLLGYLRIAHRCLNFAEILLMDECVYEEIPSVHLLNSKRMVVGPNGAAVEVGATFLSPAVGINIEEGLSNGDLEIRIAEIAFRNAGRTLAKIHGLSDSSELIAELVERERDIYERDRLHGFWDECRASLDAEEVEQSLIQEIDGYVQMLEAGFAKIVAKYPLVLNHADFDMKHVYCDPLTGEITSIIDFGEAHVSVSHADLIHWKTYSPDTYPFFLVGYLEERFGDDDVAAREFESELDFAYAVYQLKWATNRSKQGIVPEAVAHLQNCATACTGIVADRVATDQFCLAG